MKLKHYLFIAAILALGIWMWQTEKPAKQNNIGGLDYSFTTATMASSSVATSWGAAPVLAYDTSRSYALFCNDNSSTSVYLGLGATSSLAAGNMLGIRVAANSCYEMNPQDIFTGNVYAVASPTASSLLINYK